MYHSCYFFWCDNLPDKIKTEKRIAFEQKIFVRALNFFKMSIVQKVQGSDTTDDAIKYECRQ